jgi:hypothetical protein
LLGNASLKTALQVIEPQPPVKPQPLHTTTPVAHEISKQLLCISSYVGGLEQQATTPEISTINIANLWPTLCAFGPRQTVQLLSGKNFDRFPGLKACMSNAYRTSSIMSWLYDFIDDPMLPNLRRTRLKFEQAIQKKLKRKQKSLNRKINQKSLRFLLANAQKKRHLA